MTNTDFHTARATAFINRAELLGLSDVDLHIVLDDALDVDHYDRDNVLGAAMNQLLEFARTLFQSDDDYDDFRREVYAVLAGDDACDECGLDPDDCECDEDDQDPADDHLDDAFAQESD